jgi:uncharacterized protein YjbI with pentapeptide repeats
VGFLSDLFRTPKSALVVIIRNRIGEEIDRVEGVRDLWNQDLRGRQWAHAELSGLSLQGANCEGINLLGARLVRTSFYGANLKSAEISFADASGADFKKADLTDATMYRTETWHAKFDDALLSEQSDIPGRKVFRTMRVIS